MKVVILFGLLVTVLGLAEENLFVTFQSLDKDQDGILKLNDIFQYFDNYDVNGDGFLSYQEFIDGLYPEVPKVAFHFYDKLDGIKDVKIGRGVAHAILARLDNDLDSEVSYTEFTQTFPLFKDAVTRALEVLTD
ncbi:uncharacterized protein LOC112576044 [Pomacea canaliculata]|uniref:uncharacterized protein LOC112576044 n=1 Tax=Pomacea canaliculata TaxID=400727 RepID=UPI000D73F984|nr:uncharacterized protein LOC112576044 [Pomacea canaliculata]